MFGRPLYELTQGNIPEVRSTDDPDSEWLHTEGNTNIRRDVKRECTQNERENSSKESRRNDAQKSLDSVVVRGATTEGVES